MHIIDLENINEAMNNETQFVLRCEGGVSRQGLHRGGSQHPVRRQPAHRGADRPSGSGKTTTAMRLRDYLENLGVQVVC